MASRQLRRRRMLRGVGLLCAVLGLAGAALVVGSLVKEGSSPLVFKVEMIRPIPPCPPCPREENGPAGCIAATAYAVGNLPEVWIGPYTVRMAPPKEHPYPFKEVGRPASYVPTMTIWKVGEKIAEEICAEAVDPHTGMDVNSDGYPDAIVHLFTWGAHCCFGTVLYSLGPEVTRYRVGRGGECQAEFRDLDEDGVYEYFTCDDTFAYRYCPFYQTSLVRVVLWYAPGVGYVPAGPKFPEVYAEPLVRHTAPPGDGTAGRRAP